MITLRTTSSLQTAKANSLHSGKNKRYRIAKNRTGSVCEAQDSPASDEVRPSPNLNIEENANYSM